MSMADELSEAAQLAKAAMAHPAVMQLLSDLTGWGDMDMEFSAERKAGFEAAFRAASIMVELGVEI
ncbi:MAG: hypothetical protein CMK02_07940 [Polycyclovorans sp.]|jgi:hypothetical protein|nr:hypothetical protein [Rhodospirillaceae bacterium]MAY26212.1 hypothetical protein [Polycyclovorans sp.]QDP49861.1 MAG: hypothetical protein GOVbin132_5 [Prokaryotic dsDNA virus sp.]MAX61575.1 hypothetical protein [Rhodospirillaceae bacterium]MAX61640.1 hypothetical protein [Rhodospirillaceae bacterium]|tara:strand:+ start:11434 stop:11631 length:198 start_codon:yes stop_codon:yes gene_type:complete